MGPFHVLLSLGVLANVATGHYALAGVVLVCAAAFAAASWCCDPTAAATSSPTAVVRLSQRDQRKLMESVRASAKSIPCKDHQIMVPSGARKIEAVLRCPTDIVDVDGDGATNAATCFVLTHPWAILGGDLNNNVPGELSYILSAHGFSTCRFNFRGVGRSTGCCTWRGHGEREDLKSVVDWLCEEQGMKKIVLVGYSYGSMISNSCADMRPEITSFVSVSTPFPCYWGLSLFNCMKMLSWARKSEKPKLFICGSQDQFTSSRQYRKYVRSFPVRGRSDSRQNPFACYLLDDVDHFWYGQEAACAGLILKFFEKRPGLVGREVSQKNS